MTEIEAFIRAYAPTVGIDPDVAVAVAKSEGGLNDPVRRAGGPAPRSQAAGLGATENSYGPFQLYVSGTGAGLGDRAVSAGINPADPNQWKEGVMFALKEAARKGWGQWYGAANAGIDRWQGITGKALPKQYGLEPGDQPPPSLAGIGPYAPAAGPQGPVEAAGGGAGSDTPFRPSGTPYTLPEAEVKKPATLAQALGKGLGSMATAYGNATPAFRPARSIPAARLDAPGDQPPFDPAAGEAQRQQLALVLARLNSGRLY